MRRLIRQSGNGGMLYTVKPLSDEAADMRTSHEDMLSLSVSASAVNVSLPDRDRQTETRSNTAENGTGV